MQCGTNQSSCEGEFLKQPLQPLVLVSYRGTQTHRLISRCISPHCILDEKKNFFFDQIFLRSPSPRKAILKYTWVTFCSLEWKNKHDWLIKGSGLAFLQEREYPVIAEKTCHHGVLPPQVCSSQCILVYSVCLSGNRHCYAFQIVTSCKIKHVQLKNSSPWGCREKRSRASRQSHRFWKWVLIKFQTS